MKIYLGIDMAKDKFDYCAMDDTLNILCRGSNKENKNERFRELSDLIKTLKSTSTMMKIGMESTGIYHIPLYNHLRAYVMCSLNYLDSYKREYIELERYKGESRGGFVNFLQTPGDMVI